MSLHERPLGPVQTDAEALMSQLRTLARLTDGTKLQQGLVATAAQFTQCTLSQLYLLDDTGTELRLAAAWGENRQYLEDADSLSRNYLDEPLLQFCLEQRQTLNIPHLNNGLYQTTFLPAGEPGWCSVLCVPLQDPTQGQRGLLLVADRRTRDLENRSTPLSHLGHFVMAQLGLLHRLHPGPGVAAQRSPTPKSTLGDYGLSGDSPAMVAVHRLIDKVLGYPVSVLITGETGTGKELVARAIHNNGLRANKSFVVQNCASLPENLLESELFGYRRGAFTGADRDHLGLFDAADGGTLFLDEIGDMQLTLQGKLLRVLQEGEVRPLGSTKTHKVDVRIIAATHHDLDALVEAGRFRRDLFYRLSCFPIQMPPLRERGTDIQALATYFSNTFCAVLKRPPCRWSREALQQLDTYTFPGNVRELKAVVERAVLLSEDNELRSCHLNPRLWNKPAVEPQTLRQRLDQHERSLLLDCLKRNKGNQSESAREMGVSRRTFLNRMERLGIKPAEHDFGQRRA